MNDSNQYDTPPEFPNSPAQSAIDESAGYLAEALSMVRHVGRDFDRLTPDQRYRVAAGLGRELQRLSLTVAVTGGILADLGAGREPATWPYLAASGERRQLVKASRLDISSISSLVAAATVYLAGDNLPVSPVVAKLASAVLALLGWYLARITPHAAAPKV